MPRRLEPGEPLVVLPKAFPLDLLEALAALHRAPVEEARLQLFASGPAAPQCRLAPDAAVDGGGVRGRHLLHPADDSGAAAARDSSGPTSGATSSRAPSWVRGCAMTGPVS